MLEKLIAYLQGLSEEEKKKLEEALQVESNTEQTQEPEAEQIENAVQVQQEQSKEQTSEKTEVENVGEKEEERAEQTENDNVEEKGQAEQEQANDTTTEKQTEQVDTTKEELLDTKIELALIKLGIREDRLEAAKRLFKTEVKSIADLEKLKELVKEFPEWQKQKKGQSAGFGANVKESGNSLTEEEKKLKAMGIYPKN